MFVQVIQGRTNDREGIRAKFDEWQERVRPGSVGYVGSTAGVTADGEVFMAARFESEEKAQQNSDRPEQTEWWEETQKYFEGEPTFKNYTNIAEMRSGGSDDAGFVQAMQGRVKSVEKAREMDKAMSDAGASMRPDLIGGYTGYTDDGEFTSVVYFTSEAEARKAEKEEPPPEFQPMMEEWGQNMDGEMTYVDLTEPWLHSK
jgi:hypothetical protein